MNPVQITLITAAAATLVNFWLSWRIAELRGQFKVSVGDGGHEALLRRMRAQSNFTECAPLFLILLGCLELSGANRLALAIVAALFILGRIAHGVGMDGGDKHRWREIGMAGTAPPLLGLAGWAIVVTVMRLG